MAATGLEAEVTRVVVVVEVEVEAGERGRHRAGMTGQESVGSGRSPCVGASLNRRKEGRA